MADGSGLDFMKLEDIYAVFGNALDNAITAVMKLEDPTKRIVSLKMITWNNMIVIQVQNYYKADLQFEQGLPLTTKADRMEHGYGMKSIRYIAEKYNGTITVNADGDVFHLQIMMPVQENAV
jgi:sensor histidine kinase regulating citrate/malate metabolism